MSLRTLLEGEVLPLTEDTLKILVQLASEDYLNTYDGEVIYLEHKRVFTRGSGDIALLEGYLGYLMQEMGQYPKTVNEVEVIFTPTLLGENMYGIKLTHLYKQSTEVINEFIATKGSYIYEGVEREYLMLTLKNKETNKVIFRGYICMFL